MDNFKKNEFVILWLNKW